MQTVILSFPRSGSHLLAKKMWCKPYSAITRDDGPIDVDDVITRIEKGDDIWFHYPYSNKLEEYLRINKSNKYLLLRDPRDIIVSIAHYVAKVPDSPINWKHNDIYLSGMEYEDRIDAIIEIIGPWFNSYEKWRRSGIFDVFHFRDIIHYPIADKYKEEKRRGMVGSYKDEMTPKQIRKCNKIFSDLIKLW
jgi:hypothetical protein